MADHGNPLAVIFRRQHRDYLEQSCCFCFGGDVLLFLLISVSSLWIDIITMLSLIVLLFCLVTGLEILCARVGTAPSIKVLLSSSSSSGGAWWEECFPNAWSLVQSRAYNNASTLLKNRVLFREHFHVRNSKAAVVVRGLLRQGFRSVDPPLGCCQSLLKHCKRRGVCSPGFVWACI